MQALQSIGPKLGRSQVHRMIDSGHSIIQGAILSWVFRVAFFAFPAIVKSI